MWFLVPFWADIVSAPGPFQVTRESDPVVRDVRGFLRYPWK